MMFGGNPVVASLLNNEDLPGSSHSPVPVPGVDSASLASLRALCRDCSLAAGMHFDELFALLKARRPRRRV
jgi:hypothetical protein